MHYVKLPAYCLILALAAITTPNSDATSPPPSLKQNVSYWQDKWDRLNWNVNDVTAFLNFISNNSLTINQIGDFRFFKSDVASNPTLIVTVDDSGRGYFNEIYLIQRSPAGFASQDLQTHNLKKLESAIRDLNADGKQELIIPKPITTHVNADIGIASYLAIYTYVSGRWADRSSSYSTFYRENVVPNLKQQLAEIKTSTSKSTNSKYAEDLLQIALARAVDLSKGTKHEQLNQGLSLVNDPDPVRRQFAVDVLTDTSDSSAVSALMKLANDSDPTVAASAKPSLFEKLANSSSGIFSKNFTIQNGTFIEQTTTFDGIIFENSNYEMKLSTTTETKCNGAHNNELDQTQAKSFSSCANTLPKNVKITLNGKLIYNSREFVRNENAGEVRIPHIKIHLRNVLKVEFAGPESAFLKIAVIPVPAPLSDP